MVITMIIKRVEVHNIGPFVGTSTFDFETSKKRNIVLIGGKNGSGKTSILQAIKYGLFGAQAFGYKTNNASYFNQITQLLNRSKSTDHHISVSISMNENYETHHYTIKRAWDSKESLSEDISVMTEDDSKLDQREKVEFFKRIKVQNSTDLISGFIFDGEQIGSIATSHEIRTFLANSMASLFNVSMINQVETDLSSYLKSKAENAGNVDQIRLLEIYNEIETISKQLRSTSDLTVRLKSQIKSQERFVKECEEKVLFFGGKAEGQKKTAADHLRQLVKIDQENKKILKEHTEHTLPVLLMKSFLKKGEKTINDQKPVRLLHNLEEIEQYMDEDFTKIKGDLRSRITNKNPILDLSNDEEELFLRKYETYKKKISEMKRTLKKINPTNRIEKLQNIVDLQNSSSAREAVEAMNIANNELQELNDQLRIKEDRMRQLIDRSNRLQSEHKKYSEHINKQAIKENSFVMGNRALNALKEYKAKLIKAKLHRVSESASKVFNAIHSKNQYLARIDVDENYYVTLYDRADRTIEISSLSAGEKQLIISSIIYSMFKISGRKGMFVFDTPLARLDRSNRLSYIDRIISNIGDQVIVLSTDSEFVGEAHDRIKEKIARSYHLQYKDAIGSTVVSEKYFGGEE